MYCSSCGIALSQQMKYCNRCGAQLITAKDAAEIGSSVKRLDDYLDGLFWITVFGLAVILGGVALMKGLNLSTGLIIAYVILSSVAFIINFWLSLREIFRITGNSKEAKNTAQAGRLDTNELGPSKSDMALDAAPSVTENTTRRLEQLSKERITQ